MSAPELLADVDEATARIAGAPVVRLILKPLIERDGCHYDRFEAIAGNTVVYRGRHPLYGGARALLELGIAPDNLLTCRPHDHPYDAFVPRHLGELAKLTVEEQDRGSLKLRKWRPFGGRSLKAADSSPETGAHP